MSSELYRFKSNIDICIIIIQKGKKKNCQNPMALLSMEKPEPCLNIKTVFPRYGDSHVKDKTVGRLSYL